MKANTVRTSRYLPIQLSTAWLAAALAILNPDVAASVYAMLLFAGVHLYVFWFSKLKRDADSPLIQGALLPEFALNTLDGESRSNNDLLGKPSLLVFYRGNWCPLCVAQVRQYAEQYKELLELGVRLLLISPQPAKDTAELASRFDAPDAFFIDKNLAVTKKWRLLHVGGVPNGQQDDGATDTVFPTVVITDAENQVCIRGRHASGLIQQYQ